MAPPHPEGWQEPCLGIIPLSDHRNRRRLLSLDIVEQFVSDLPFRLDPFQLKAILAISEGRSVLVAAPTGTGKTVVAEFAVRMALSRDLRAIYTTPIKALSNQKFRDFRARYGDRVGLLTGDLVENPGGRLLVMTTEVARNMLVQDRDSFQDVGCLVFDEVHYLADPERGTAWEESILLAPSHVPLVCLSATVANAGEVAEWIRATGREVSLVESFERAVPLRHRYYLQGSLHPILDGAAPPPTPTLPKTRGQPTEGARTGNSRWCRSRRGVEVPSGPDSPEVVRALAAADLLPAIYFLFSRKAVETAAEACQRLNLLSHRQMAEVRLLTQRRMAELPPEDRELDQVQRLLALLPRGIAFHHAGLLPPLKTLVEELLASGRLKAVFATDTLALGINVPARSVVVGEMVKFDGTGRRPLLAGEYRQLTGRAGRRGMDSVGYSVLLDSPWVGFDRTLEIATGEVAPLESAFRPGYNTVINLWRGSGDEDRLARLIAGSLRQFQEGNRVRTLARERDELASTLAAIPPGCALDGGSIDWLEREKALQREHERAESVLEAARRDRSALEGSIIQWPWRYTKNQKREWLRSARTGAAVYSRKWGWGLRLGPSSAGIGAFLFGETVVDLASYADLDYLPDPPLLSDLPDDLTSMCARADASGNGLEADDLRKLSAALARLDTPDLEATARDAADAARANCAAALAAAEERVASARERLRNASLALEKNPCRSCHLRASHRRANRQRRNTTELLAVVEREMASAGAESRRRAQRTLRSIRSVLETLGYMAVGQPTSKARALTKLFDSNSLIVAELLDWGVLADVSAPELAEVASWFAFDREGSGRAISTSERLARLRSAAETVAKKVLEVEHRFGVNLSHPLAPQFRGVALAWATGATLSDLSARSGLAEGDIVFALQKTIDLCRQIGQAAGCSRSTSLVRRAAEAERLLRRGVVDSYYRWVVEAQDGIALPTHQPASRRQAAAQLPVAP